MKQLRGSQDRVLQVLAEMVKIGRNNLSYLDLSVESGYSLESVRCAVRNLEDQHYIRVTRGGPRCPNCYEIVSERDRRAYSIAQLMGL